MKLTTEQIGEFFLALFCIWLVFGMSSCFWGTKDKKIEDINTTFNYQYKEGK